MKIKKGFVVREIAGQTIVIALGEATKIFNGMIKLNESGRSIWDMLVVGAEKSDIVKMLTDTYEVNGEIAARDVDAFVNTLQGANILE